MKKRFLTLPLIFLIIFASYLSPLLGISIDNSNILVVLITYICIFIGLFTKEIYFKRGEILLIILQLAIATIAVKANLVSLTIIVLLNVFFKQYGDNNSIDYYTRISLLFFVAVVMSYYLFGFHKIYDSSMWRIDSMVDRKSIGFTQPNQAMIAWVGVFFGFVLKKNKNDKYKYILLLLSSSMIYYQTKSRTGYIILFGILALMILFKNILNKEVPNSMRMILVYLPLMLLGISIWLVTQSNNLSLNSLLTGRPILYKKFFDLAGITLWGSKVIENQMLDNSYLSMLLGKGLVFTGLYIITLMYLVLSVKKLSVRTYIVLSLFFVYGLTETMLFKFELLLPIIISLHAADSGEQIKESHHISRRV